MFKFLSLGVLFLTNAALAAPCELAIEGNDAMQFNVKELKVPASCKEVTVKLKHTGKLPKTAMGHNWMLLEEKDLKTVTEASTKAGIEKDYNPKTNVIAATKVIGGGESTSVKVDVSKLKKDKSYIYICSFPGHFALMQGKFILQ